MNIEHPRPGQLPQLKALWAEAFGDTAAFIDSFFSSAYASSRCMCIWEGSEVIAAAYWLNGSYEQGKLAYIYAVATAKKHQGKGLCHKLMAAIHDTLTQQGYAGAVLVPGSPSLSRLYQGMGYAFFGGIEALSCAAAEESTPLRHLSPMEYVRLRQRFLPEGGVRQAEENLRFLSLQARFCAGEDFLLAYAMDGGKLLGLELLGNAKKAPAIVKALGAAEGRFRIPGKEAFAMFRPLLAEEAPHYLGFAFD